MTVRTYTVWHVCPTTGRNTPDTTTVQVELAAEPLFPQELSGVYAARQAAEKVLLSAMIYSGCVDNAGCVGGQEVHIIWHRSTETQLVRGAPEDALGGVDILLRMELHT